MLLELLNGNVSQEEYLRMNNVKLLFKKMPRKIYGCVFNYKNYNFIVISTCLSDRKQKYTLLHELAHIELNHLNKRKKILEFKIEGLEDEADEYMNNLIYSIKLD